MGEALMLPVRLKEVRKKRKLTQYQAAEKMGLSRGQLANYEQGSREPDYDTLLKIANFYNVTTDYLIGKSDDPRLTAEEAERVINEYKEIIDILEGLPEDKKEEKIAQIKAYARFIKENE